MQADDIWWSYWYFHLPNYVMAALLYTMFGRFLMSFIVPPDSPNYIWRWFKRLTDPLLAIVRIVTPATIGPRPLPLAGAFWLAVARLAFYLALASAGLTPTIGRGAGP